MIFQLQPAASCDEKLVVVQPGSINHLYRLVDCVYRNDLQRMFLNKCFFQQDKVCFPHLFLCPHLDTILLIKVSWAEENAASVQMECLNKAVTFQTSHLWKRSLQTKYPNATVTKVKQEHTCMYVSPLSLLYSVWVCQREAGRLVSPWWSDLRSRSAAAFQRKRGQSGLKSHIINFSVDAFRKILFFFTSSYQENGVFDVCYSTAHLLHPFSQLESLRKTSQCFKLKRQKKQEFYFIWTTCPNLHVYWRWHRPSHFQLWPVISEKYAIAQIVEGTQATARNKFQCYVHHFSSLNI